MFKRFALSFMLVLAFALLAQGQEIAKMNPYMAGGGSGGLVIDDYYPESNYESDKEAWVNSYGPESYQSFTSGGGTLDSVKFYLSKIGSPTGNAVARLFAHSGTYGSSSVPTGSPLATSDTFDVSGLTTSPALITFDFTGDDRITLSSDTYYVVTLYYTGGDWDNVVLLGRRETSCSHSGNSGYYDTSWHIESNDCIFYIYVIK